jgi:hypothetical protein
MTDIDDLLRQVLAKAGATAGRLPLPATAEEVAQAESLVGFGFPPVLVRLYREVANGGFGPDYQLFPPPGSGAYRRDRLPRGTFGDGAGW